MLLSSGGEAPRGCLIHICLIDTCPIERGQGAVCVYVFAKRPGQPGGINELISAEKKILIFKLKLLCLSSVIILG